MEILNHLKKNNAPSEHNFLSLIDKINFKFDEYYLRFIKNHDGAEGFLNKENYIQLWTIENLITLNPYYTHEPICNDYFFFASDGSNLGYAFNKKNQEIIGIDFLEIGITDPIIIAPSFEQFISFLSTKLL